MADKTSLGEMLRTWRDRAQPSDLGLLNRTSRRTPGLRREDVASVAGLSVDYLVRLEQGRANSPSAPVVASLARALQLEDAERDHLYRLAGLLPPSATHVSNHVPASVQRLVTRLGEIPVAVFAADWTMLQWSSLWAAMFGDPGDIAIEQRNYARMVFTPSPTNRGGEFGLCEVTHAAGEDAHAAALVGDLRVAAAKYPDDEHLARLIAELRRDSTAFAILWQDGGVGEHPGGRKTIRHPQAGEITVDCDHLLVPGSDLKIVAHTVPAGSIDAERLDFLRVAAIQAATPALP